MAFDDFYKFHVSFMEAHITEFWQTMIPFKGLNLAERRGLNVGTFQR